MDHLYLPAASGNADRAIIISAGVHGAEGPAGAALMELFLSERLPTMSAEERARTNILLLHAPNPWGYREGFRFDAGNIDVNRQGLARDQEDRLCLEEHGVSEPYSFAHPPPSDYPAVASAIESTRPLHSFAWHRASLLLGMVVAFFRLAAKSPLGPHLEVHGARGIGVWFGSVYRRLTQAIGGGQYNEPQGVMYGGKERLPVVNAAESLIARAVTGVREAIHLDAHTGLGRASTLHLIDDGRAPEDRQYAQELFAGHAAGSDWVYTNASTPGFYEVVGAFGRLTERNLKRLGRRGPQGERPRGAYVTVEWGTIGDSLGAKLDTIAIVTAMNRYRRNGGDAALTARLGRRLFNPDPRANPSATAFMIKVVQTSMAAIAALPGLQGPRYGRFGG